MKENEENEFFNIELPDMEKLNAKHLQLVERKAKKYESTFANALNNCRNIKSDFISEYVTFLKREILNETNLYSDDRNSFIKILDIHLTTNSQRIYEETTTGI